MRSTDTPERVLIFMVVDIRPSPGRFSATIGVCRQHVAGYPQAAWARLPPVEPDSDS